MGFRNEVVTANDVGAGDFSASYTVSGLLRVGNPAASHIDIGGAAGGIKLYANDGVTVLIDLDTSTGSGSITSAAISGGTISGTNVSGVTVTGSTIIGGTVETATSGARVVLNGASGQLEVYDIAGSFIGRLYNQSSGVVSLLNPLGGGFVQIAGSGGVVITGNNVDLNANASVASGFGTITAGAANINGNVAATGTVRGSDSNHVREAQSGTNSSLSLSAATTVTGTVTFPRAFAAAPVVTASIATTAGGSKGLTIRISSVTSSGFSLTIDAAASTTLASIPVAWHAQLTN